MNVTVLLETGPLALPIRPGQTLPDILREHDGLPIHAPCGGQGTCQTGGADRRHHRPALPDDPGAVRVGGGFGG